MKRSKTLPLIMTMLIAVCMMKITAFAGAVLVWPVPASHTISQGLHDGNAIDISAAAGTQIVAAMGGTVTKITKCTQTHYNYGDCNGFGTGLVILGDDGRAYQYAHMQGGSIPDNVWYGARVEAGQAIGRVGSTGYAYGPHLHFGISNTRNYWEAGSNPLNETYASADSSVQISVGNLSAANISETNAKLSGTLYKAPGWNCSVCGIYLGTSRESMTKRNAEAVGSAANNYRGGNSFDIWYDLTGELGITLQKATTYYYTIYAVVNGREYTGPVCSFKTAGTVSVPAAAPAAAQASSSASEVPAVSSAAETQQAAAAKKAKVKKAQALKVSPAKPVFNYSSLKKNSRSFVIKVSGSKGKVTIKSKSKYLKVSGKKITLRKKTPKGSYKIVVSAAGNSSYKAASKTIIVKVR